jgi:hypothetical protein
LKYAYTNLRILGLTISGDGTLNKHLNYESKFVMLKRPLYDLSERSGMSKTQLQGWKDVVTHMYEIYNGNNNASPLGWREPANQLKCA